MEKVLKTAKTHLADTGKVHPFVKGRNISFCQHYLLALLLFMLLFNPAYGEVHTKEIKIYFDFDSCTITSREKEKLKNTLTTELAVCDSFSILGYADSVGNLEYNRRLSQKRLENVQAFLCDTIGIRAVLSGAFLGEEKPLLNKKGEYIPLENRCVRIIYKNKELAELEKQVSVPKSSIDTVILTKSGVEITIDTCTFVGVPFDEIELEYIEVFNTDDMKKYNLQTIDENNRCLSSGGMFYIKATSQNVELNINPECPIKMKAPIIKRSSNMGLYRMNEKTGKWYKSGPDDIYTDNNSYSFNIDNNGWCNLDFPIGGAISKGLELFNPYKGLAIQTKKVDGLNVYLVSKADNFAMPLKMKDRDKLVYVTPRQCIDGNKAEIHISKDGYKRELRFRINSLKYRKLKNKYVVDKSRLAIFEDK